MTTITEILAEAFNRVKTEHGVTLSRVDFSSSVDHTYIQFKTGVHSVKQRDVAVPSFINVVPFGGQLMPEGATHYGSVGSYTGAFWKFESDELRVWGDLPSWLLYAEGGYAQSLAETLTPIDGSPPYQP